MRGRAAGGWNAHQFHANSEFYADFGHYRVAITAPRRFVIGATGVRTARVEHPNGTTTHTYEQGNVHDFAWTASPRFVEITRRYVAAREVTSRAYADAAARLGRSIDDLRLGDVEVRLLMQPDHLPQAERYLRATMQAITAFGLAFGRYPHPTLTIVDPPESAIGTAGMERQLDAILAGLDAVLKPKTVILRNDAPNRALEGLDSYVRAARGEGAGGLELVLVLDDQHVGIVDAHRLDRDHREPGLGLRRRHLFQHQGFRSAHGLAQQRLHRGLSRRLMIGADASRFERVFEAGSLSPCESS
jgi:hypothetical protein